ncbi:MAG: DegT/DnrJ/EryC1/StrS family aminotransferase, partial [Bacteroidota bacterium]|nr:DegT/DnrJ/EryC1/StrS family aminotransferase [Bacteroidota bacterium]
MGLCLLPRVKDFIEKRKAVNLLYKNCLKESELEFPEIPDNIDYNYSYFPVIFPNENKLLKIKEALSKNNINTRRYFYPSLNRLPYINSDVCAVSEDIASRMLCLPMYQQLDQSDVINISNIIIDNL